MANIEQISSKLEDILYENDFVEKTNALKELMDHPDRAYIFQKTPIVSAIFRNLKEVKLLFYTQDPPKISGAYTSDPPVHH